MYRKNSNGNEVLRRFVQHAESYNRCMFPKQLNNDHVIQQILSCQNQIENLNISKENILMVDIISNEYKYDRN